MSQKTRIRVIYSFCAIIIFVAATFFSLKFVFPKTHLGNENTTSEHLSLTSIKQTITETISETVTTVKTEKATATESTSESVESTSKTESENLISTVAPQTATSTSTTVQTTFVNVTDDFSCLDNCAFIGNSRVIALKNYGLVKNAYAVVGLTVDTIFTNSVAGSTIPVIDELNGKEFDKIFIMLGDNECGWSNKEIFLNKYSKVIDAVKERVPNAEIYLQSILPVSKKASDTSPFGVTNDNINEMNSRIQQLAADSGVYYISPATALKNSDGALPDDAASDGIHLNKKYCKIWLSYIIENVFSGEIE